MVFDFVDKASQYNMPQSLHRLFKLKEYKPGQLAVAPGPQKAAEAELYARGEKPEALIDWPVDATDYELVDIFNWQEEAESTILQMEFVRRVDVQTETIERYVREGKLVSDLVVPMSEHRTFKYFKEETLEKYAQQCGWTLIDDSNRKDMFLVRQMDMSYSYKPVLMKAILLRGSPCRWADGRKEKQYLCKGRLHRQKGRAEYPGQSLQTFRGYANAPPHQDLWHHPGGRVGLEETHLGGE